MLQRENKDCVPAGDNSTIYPFFVRVEVRTLQSLFTPPNLVLVIFNFLEFLQHEFKK